MSYSRQLRISGPSVGNTLGDKGGDYAIIEPGGIIIGEAYHCIGEDAYRDAEANARLWAAASDLRAALEALEGEADKMRQLLIEVTPLLYRDEIQGHLHHGLMDKVKAWLQSAAPDKAIQQARAALAGVGEAGE